MGADVRFYIEKYNKKEKTWEYAGAYNKKGEIVPLTYVRAHNYMPYIEDLCLTDGLTTPYTDVCEEIFEKFRDHFDEDRKEYDGIYAEGAVTLAELDRAALRTPEVDNEDADDDEWTQRPDGSWQAPKMENPLRELYRRAAQVADMMNNWVFDDREFRLVYFCDN